MNNLIPTDFVEALAGFVSIIAILAGGASLFPGIRGHATKLLAILFVASLALFANHWSTYFAALFVIATAVTELEFLQNLAAIIRGNKEYFDYKKQSLSSEQKAKKIESEQKELVELGISKPKSSLDKKDSVERKGPPSLSKIIEAEKMVMDRMELYFDKKIDRNVSISSGSRHLELDGLIPSVIDDVVPETIIEVKFIRNIASFNRIKRMFPHIENMARVYNDITRQIAKIHLVLVIEGESTLTKEQFDSLKQLVDSSRVAMGYSVFTTHELGIE